MKPWYLWISAGALILFGFLLSQEALARLAWQRYGRADIALALNRRDVGLAMQLGNYYFNGEAYDLDRAVRTCYRPPHAVHPGHSGSA